MPKPIHRCGSVRESRQESLAAESRAKGRRLNAGEVLARLGDYIVSRPVQLPLEGAQSDNMAPSKYGHDELGDSVRVLHQSLDTLVLNYYGVLRDDVVECLAMAKEDAQASRAGESASPLPPFDGVTPRMQDSGVKYYEWRLLSRDVTVMIARPSRSRRPNAVLRVSSECLHRLGYEAASRLAAGYLLAQFVGYARVQVGAAHACTDYQGYVPKMADRRGLVKRVKKPLADHISPDADGLQWCGYEDEAQSFAAGRSTVIRGHFYDKTAEIKKSGKEWFKDIWARHKGYDASAPVLRYENQWGREFLKEMKIETVDDLLAGLGGLWAYSMGWLSFRTVNPDDMRNRSRWPVAPWWLALSAWRSVESEPLPRVKVVRPVYRQIVSGFFGYLTSLMAITEHDDVADATWAACLSVVDTRGPGALVDALDAKRLRYAGFTLASA